MSNPIAYMHLNEKRECKRSIECGVCGCDNQAVWEAPVYAKIREGGHMHGILGVRYRGVDDPRLLGADRLARYDEGKLCASCFEKLSEQADEEGRWAMYLAKAGG